MFSQTLAMLGIITILYLAIRFFRFIHLYARPSSLKRYLHGPNAWALVTGASDGIGRAFAQELHGRNHIKLESIKAQLQNQFPIVEFRVLVADA